MSESVAAPQRPRPQFHLRPALKRFKVPAPVRWVGYVLLALIAAVLLFLAFADWNMLRGPIGRFASARLDRTVELRGDLNVHPWSWTPRAEINDLYIADAPWGGRPHLARVQRVEVSVKLLPILKGDFILPRVAVVRPDLNLLRNAKGQANWTLGDPKKTDKDGAELPLIQHLIIDSGRVRLDDRQRSLTLDATVSTSERSDGSGGRSAFRLSGEGALNREPFTLAITGGPLVNIRKDRPYPFDARITGVDTRLVARGDIIKPFDLGRFQTVFDMRGPDMNRLYGLTGLALPNTPPYQVRGRLTREGSRYEIAGLAGKVGDSDVSGKLTVETKGERPKLTADLRSRRLDFDDLATVFGGAPDPRETASAEQKAVAASLRSSGRLMPDATLQVERVRAMDADVTYRAVSIVSPTFPVTSGSLKVDLNAGVLNLNEIELGLRQGRLTGDAKIDARQATPLVDIDLRMTGLALQQFLTRAGGTPVTGNLVARAKLTGSGSSVRRAAATADGTITIVVPRGEIREAFAELAGVNVIKGLGLLFSKDQGKVVMSCAIADFRANDGVLTANRLVIDTEPVLISGRGTISLRDETLNLEFKGNPKKFRLISLNVPVTLQGTLKKPDPGAKPGGAIAQGGIAAALAAVVNPIAAILPFVDPGLTDDANCSALLSGARGKGAPVTSAQVRRAPTGG